jgi:transposase InsO family protein
VPRGYSVELRGQVVDLARSGTKVTQLAETFGVTQATIYNWLKQDRIDRGEQPELSTEGQMELAAAKRPGRSGTHGLLVRSRRCIRTPAALTGSCASRRSYGTAAVSKSAREQVHLIMKRLGIYGLPKRRLPRGAKLGKASSLDLVRRGFTAGGPDRLWMTDITEHPTREGKVYCCAVIDAFSRMVVGWSIDSRQTGLLVTNALGMALRRRSSERGGIIHSDQGVQFASWVFSQKVTEAGLAPSVGAVGGPVGQCHGRGFLGQDASRATEPAEMEDPRTVRHRDPRLHRDLAQHQTPPQRPKHAHASRIREQPPPPKSTTRDRRLIPETRLRATQATSLGLRRPWPTIVLLD